jgi:hypothetical protein
MMIVNRGVEARTTWWNYMLGGRGEEEACGGKRRNFTSATTEIQQQDTYRHSHQLQTDIANSNVYRIEYTKCGED